MLTENARILIVMGMYYGVTFGIILDVLLSVAIVALYYSFLKRCIAYYDVTDQLDKAIKERT